VALNFSNRRQRRVRPGCRSVGPPGTSRMNRQRSTRLFSPPPSEQRRSAGFWPGSRGGSVRRSLEGAEWSQPLCIRLGLCASKLRSVRQARDQNTPARKRILPAEQQRLLLLPHSAQTNPQDDLYAREHPSGQGGLGIGGNAIADMLTPEPRRISTAQATVQQDAKRLHRAGTPEESGSRVVERMKSDSQKRKNIKREPLNRTAPS
jgi:hypothetical protein